MTFYCILLYTCTEGDPNEAKRKALSKHRMFILCTANVVTLYCFDATRGIQLQMQGNLKVFKQWFNEKVSTDCT